MWHRNSTAIRWWPTGLALLVLATPAAPFQADSDKPKPDEKKKTEAKRLDVRVKVSTMDGKPLPAGSIVEITGKEPACGSLSSIDAHATVDEKGEAIFRDLPACKVTVKVNLQAYKPGRSNPDLRDPKSCGTAVPGKGNSDAEAAAGSCELSLVLEPL